MSSVPLRFFALATSLCLVWVASSARADKTPENRDRTRPDPSAELDLIESTERSEDPLGIDESTGKDLDQAAARIPRPKSTVILPTASQGAALSAIAGVREARHALTVKLAQGLAFVDVQLALVSTAKHAAEVAYRLPLPTTGVVTRVCACIGKLCSEAAHEPALAITPVGAPSIDARPIEDERGRALSLRVSPLAAGGKLELTVSYVAEAAVRGGRARFDIEARGYDPNLASTELRVEAPRRWLPEPDRALTLEPWTPYEVTASLPSEQRSLAASALAARAEGLRSSTQVACGTGACTRTFESSARAPAELRSTWLWIDASPSMEGPARSRVSAVIAALLGVLPEATDVRAFAFAARASELGRFRARDAPLLQLADATMLELDAATLPSAAIALAGADLLRARPRLLVVSDGLFDATAHERAALLTLKKQGIELTLIALGDKPPRLLEAFTRVLHVATLAEASLHGAQLGPLEDALRGITAPSSRGLKAGEQRVREKRPERRWTPRPNSPWLSFWMARDRPSQFVAEAPTTSASIAAVAYRSVERAAPPEDTGLPKESVLTMLRTQLVPQARACLRTDRKGRGDYAVGLAFHALFAEREVYDARVEGNIARPLRACLMAILPRLRVPLFSGRIRVRYPIYTEREAEPPMIELEPELGRQLERAFSPAPALP